MTRQVLYVAHPVAPTQGELVDAIRFTPEDASDEERVRIATQPVRDNIKSAMRWLAWLRKSFPETTFIAPWIAGIMSGEDNSVPAQREAGLVDCCAVVERCDGIVLCGGRISSGMRREMEHGRMRYRIWIDPVDDRPGFEVYDLTGYQPEGDAGCNADRRTFAQWMDRYRESCTR